MATRIYDDGHEGSPILGIIVALALTAGCAFFCWGVVEAFEAGRFPIQVER